MQDAAQTAVVVAHQYLVPRSDGARRHEPDALKTHDTGPGPVFWQAIIRELTQTHTDVNGELCSDGRQPVL